MDKEQNIADIKRVLAALEPWLMQMLLWNPDDKYLDSARIETATALAELAEEFESSETADIPLRPFNPKSEEQEVAEMAARRAGTEGCTLGEGCDEAGVCYAAAHGQPEQCGRK